MPVVIVDMWDGRTIEQKKILIQGITDAFGKIGVPAGAVQVVLNDIPRHNWGIGGKLASEQRST